MGLGNLFSGSTEDLLLYVAAPASLFVLATSLVVGQWHVSRRFRAGAESWRDPNPPRLPSNDADYRAPASTAAPAEVPPRVRRIVRFGLVWSALTVLAFALIGLLAYGALGWLAALLAPLAANAAAVCVIRAVLVLPERSDPRVLPRLAQARTALLVHHGLLALVAIAFAVPLYVSAIEVGPLTLMFAIVVILPGVVGYTLLHALDTVRALYPVHG